MNTLSAQPQLPHNRSMPPGIFIPVLPYPEVAPAVKWLGEAFGFVERLRIGNHRVQMVFGSGGVVVTGSPQPIIGNQSIMVRIENADRHFERACQQNGARIIHPPNDFPYGERQYTVEDFAGYRWTFSQTFADVDPGDWGGVFLDGSEKVGTKKE